MRNERPFVPSFHKAPMPDRSNADKERNAMLVMTYLHPFTLLKNESVDVPHVSELRRGNDKWETALVQWLAGNVLTYEARNFIQNFFFVAPMRPDFVVEEKMTRISSVTRRLTTVLLTSKRC